MVAFRFRDDVPEGERKKILEELNRFPKYFPLMQNWKLGPNISQRDKTFSHTFIVEFGSERELLDYLATERHEEFVATRFRPNIAQRAIVTLKV